MTLIKSISGIRGTIGGKPGEGLSPLDIVKFTSAYATFLKNISKNKKLRVVVGRDARLSGSMVSSMVNATLCGMGIDVLDAGLATTPTVEIGVTLYEADGGIIITASHNPEQWNALKLLNNKGEFLSDDEGKQILAIAEAENFEFAPVKSLGKISRVEDLLDKHIDMILALPEVNAEAIRKSGFRVAIDCVNSVGGIAIPALLTALGVKKVDMLYCEPNGRFPHNPEPLPENLGEISEAVKKNKADLGFVVDPDVDRLAIVTEDGEMFGEEYTLVACADYILKNNSGNTVSNLSSTRSLKEITLKAGGEYFASAVGEVNVVQVMKEKNAVIGGEGNGGVIFPALHYGRDALVGIALFLSHLAVSGKSCSMLRSLYPTYHISKNKIELPPVDINEILEQIVEKYHKQPISTIDGVRIEFGPDWVHLRKSNTESIIRIYSESDTQVRAEHLAKKLIEDIREILRPN